MTGMFQNCCKLENLDLSNFKTKEVTIMKELFKGCNSLKYLDISSIDTSNVKDMSEMFSECNSLNSLNLSNFKTNNVKNMNKMFNNCSSLLYINLSNFESDNLNNINEMFSGCSSLKGLDASKFNFNDKVNISNMLLNCPFFNNLKNDYISEINKENIEIKLKEQCELVFEKESQIIIQNVIKNKKFCNNNKIIINDIAVDLINKIKNINILLVGEAGENKIKLINDIINIKNEKFKLNNENNYFKSGLLKFFEIDEIKNDNIEKIIQKIDSKINDLTKKDSQSTMNLIWLCISGTIKNNNIANMLKKINNKYSKAIPIFIIYLYSNLEEKENFVNIKEYFNKEYLYEIIQVSVENKNNKIELNEIFMKIKNYINNFVYKKIQDNSNNYLINSVKDKIKEIEKEKNLNNNDNLINSLLIYIEKLLGKKEEITEYLKIQLGNCLNISKINVDNNILKSYIENFKENELKLKVNDSIKMFIKNLLDELNKDIKVKYTEIRNDLNDKIIREEFYNKFTNIVKTEAEHIVEQSINNLKKEDLNSMIENNLKL